MVTENIKSSESLYLGQILIAVGSFFTKTSIDEPKRVALCCPFETWGFSFTVQTRKKTHYKNTEKVYVTLRIFDSFILY